MNWYYFLNYRIYKFYLRKKESMPAFFSFMATITLLNLNFLSVFGLLSFFYPSMKSINKFYALIFMVILGVINYLVLYRRKYYIEVFDDFDREREDYKKWDKSVTIYIIASILFVLITLAIADYRHDGHF